MKIYFVLLRFSLVSLMAALIDNFVFYLVWKRTGHILGAQVVARLAAVAFNYSMVRARVFASREGHEVLLPKYLLLVVTSGTASYLGIQLFMTRLAVSAMPAKLFVETLLFFVNFAVQRTFIFHGPEANGARLRRAPSGRFYTGLILAVLAVLVARRGLRLRRRPSVFPGQSGPPKDARALLQFGALYVAAATALLILAPWIFAALAAALLVLFTAIAIGPLALLAVVFFLLSAWSLGALMMVGRTPWSARPTPPSARSSPLLLGIATYIFLMPFAARLPVNYPWVYALVLSLPILANRSAVRRATSRHSPPPRGDSPALLGRAPGLRSPPLCPHHPLVRHARARDLRGRPLDPSGDPGKHRRQPRHDVRPRAHHVGRHAHGRGFHLVDRLPARRRDGRAPAQLRNPPRAAGTASPSGPPLGFARRRMAAGDPVRHHAHGATGHRIPIRGKSAGRICTRHDDRALALRGIRAIPLSVPRRGPRRHCHGNQIRRHRHPDSRARLRRRGSVAPQEEDRHPMGTRSRTDARRCRATLRHRLGQDRQSHIPVPQRQVSLPPTRSQSRHPGHSLPRAAHLEHAVRPHLPQQSLL